MWLRSRHFTASVWVDLRCFLCICSAQQCCSCDCTRRTLSRYLNTTLYLPAEERTGRSAVAPNTYLNRPTHNEHALLQDGRREEDVQRPLDFVGETQGRPACWRDLTRGGVLWWSGSISGACCLWKKKNNKHNELQHSEGCFSLPRHSQVWTT